MNKTTVNPNRNNYEPIFLNARREALVTIAVWIIGLAWTVGCCSLTGYDVPADEMKVTFGMPNWIFWGVLVPWVLIILFTIWFGLLYIAEDELVQGQHEPEREGFHNPPLARDEVSQ